MKLTRMIPLVAVCLLFAVPTLADIARPKESPAPTKPPAKYVISAPMEIVPDSKTYSSARLQISAATLKEISESMNETATTSSTGGVNRNKFNTIVAGLFLFMSISFAGVWLARSRSGKLQAPKAAALVLLSMGFIGATAIVTIGNAGPPPSYYWRNLTKNLNDGRSTSGGVNIEIVPDGNGVKLIVPMKKSGNGYD